jgi:hypothetical protein
MFRSLVSTATDWAVPLAGPVLLLLITAALPFAAANATAESPEGRLDWRLRQLVTDYQSGSLPPVMASEVHGVAVKNGRAQVIIETHSGQAGSVSARAGSLGALVEAAHGPLLQVSVPIPALEGLAAVSGVAEVRPPLRAYPLAVTGEGVALTGADDWQASAVTGAGVKVAVLDLGFQGYEAQLGNELPATVTPMSFVSGGDIHGGGETHGTGVAEIVHEMAPGAEMYLANFSTEVELANAAAWLTSQGVRVINASWGYFTSGPGDGTGIVDEIIEDSVNSGVFWAVAAGNHVSQHWSGQFTDTDSNGFHEFSQSPLDEGNQVIGSFFGYTLPGEEIVAELKWNDPYGAACRDYDL